LAQAVWLKHCRFELHVRSAIVFQRLCPAELKTMGCSSSAIAVPAVTQQNFSDNYQLGEKIGEGAFGNVYTATSIRQSGYYAAKVLDLSSSSGSERRQQHQVRQLKNEIEIWKGLGTHDNCVRLLDTFFDGSHAHFVMDRCECALMSFLAEAPLSSVCQASRMCCDMLAGIAHIHSTGAVHCDVKPENFLMDCDKRTVKLCDFGLSQKLEPGRNLRGCAGTAPCVSPEMLHPIDPAFSYKTDLWSLGITVYMLFFGTWAYAPHCPPAPEVKDIILRNYPLPTYVQRKHCATMCFQPSDDMKSFVRALLTRATSKRPSAMFAYRLPFVRQVAFDRGHLSGRLPWVAHIDGVSKSTPIDEELPHIDLRSNSDATTHAESCAIQSSGTPSTNPSQIPDDEP